MGLAAAMTEQRACSDVTIPALLMLMLCCSIACEHVNGRICQLPIQAISEFLHMGAQHKVLNTRCSLHPAPDS